MSLDPSSPPEHPDLARSRFAVGVLCLPLLLGLLIRVQGGRATFLGMEGPTCVLGEWCGPAGCPACGLTRSTALTMKGDFGPALALNWAGPCLVLACLGGLALHLDILLRARRRTHFHERLLGLGTAGLFLAVLLAWVARLLPG